MAEAKERFRVKISMEIEKEGKEFAEFLLKYGNVDRDGVLMLEGKMLDLASQLHELGQQLAEQRKTNA